MAAQCPDAVALEGRESRLTYRELDEKSNCVAASLAADGVRHGDLVGLFLGNRQSIIECVLGILKAGGAFVPLSPDLPAGRLDSMLEECTPKWAVVAEHLRDRFASLEVSRRISVVSSHVNGNGAAFAPVESDGNDLSYIYFTSGTTGRPKGIAGRLRGIDHFIRWEVERFGLGPGSRVSQLMSPMFDAFLRDIFAPLCSGGTVCIPPAHEVLLDGRRLGQWIAEQRITLAHMVPSVFRLMINQCPPEEHLPLLRYVLLAGEPLLPADVKRWYEVAGKEGGHLVNLYGTSETTMAKFAYEISEQDQFRQVIPVGKPIKGAKALVLDEEGVVCPPGMVGEIYIRTPYRSLGYYGKPGLTNEVFVPNPFGKDPLDVVHKTGDLGRVLEDGNFEVLGRRDTQIKIRGQRVELGEIEAALTKHEGVAQAAVVAVDVEDGEKKLVAYLVARAGAQVDFNELRQSLKGQLPEHMLPSGWGLLDALPLTSNGKVDRQALEQMKPEFGLHTRNSSRQARTPAEEMLCSIWEEVLKVHPVGANDNFFELGGHSLLAGQLTSRIQIAFSVELPIQAVFEGPTVAEMAQRIEQAQRRGEGPGMPPLRRVRRMESIPLSYAQQRLWFMDQLEPGLATYNIPAAVRIQGPLDVQALEKVLTEITRRHESLRTRFIAVAGTPRQVIEENVALSLPLFDLSAMPEHEREAEARRLAFAGAQTPFDLSRAPLLRARLMKLSAEDHVLAMTMHHIVSDAWSVGILIREVSELYGAIVAGKPPDLPPLPVQYSDYSVWQRGWLKDEVIDQQLTYWKQQLAGLTPLELPSDRARPAARSYRGATLPFSLPLELMERLKELSRAQGATLYMTLLAAFQALLHRYTGQTDIAVGTPIAGRRQPETEGLIGFFINTLVMRTDFSGNPGFTDVLRNVKRVTLEAFAHQDLPFERLVEALQPERHLSRAPLFQVAFALQNVPPAALQLGEARLLPMGIDSGTAKFDLWVPLSESSAGLQGVMQYSTDLFDEGTIRRMVSHFEVLLTQVAAEPQQPLDDASLLTEPERRQFLEEWCRVEPSFPHDQCIHELFSEQARQTPNAMAVVGRGTQLLYSELEARSNQLARYLQSNGVRPEMRVGICMERSPEMIVAQMGILKAGAAQVALDLDYPADRLGYMIKDSDARFLIGNENTKKLLASYGPPSVCLDSDWAAIASHHDGPLPALACSENAAWVIYTSGSTGKPKGSVITHRAIARTVQHTNFAQVLSTDRVAQLTNSSFDISVYEVCSALLNGATLVIIDRETTLDASELGRRFSEEKINVSVLPSALFRHVARTGPGCFSGFRYVFFGGEAADVQCVRRVLQEAAPEFLMNLYGPTESTIFATWFAVKEVAQDADNIPIGWPLANTEAYVLDDAMNLSPVGVPGEICLGGMGLARGYLDRPDFTAERFVPNPFSRSGGERLYRTGDLGRWTAAGVLEYRGRMDFQVKIRGYRIELGEIEAVLKEHSGVEDVVVIAWEDQIKERRLVAYVAAPAGLQAEELRDALSRKLPEYMVPSVFVVLPAMPLTPNGKIDRKALPAPERPSAGNEYVAPRNEIEERLARIWSEVLGLDRIGIHDNFFELGGHSLLATQVVARAQDVFQQNFPLRRLFESPTIAGLARIIEDLSQTEAAAPAQSAALPAVKRLNRAAMRHSAGQE
ncbi:MAG: amino acid adenylation domain-containing protein [Acidobacteriia bacterium]|nr:amino acid adenylation domain-containing protein [Terriglobia bacterium]